jgi:hypothetical protein
MLALLTLTSSSAYSVGGLVVGGVGIGDTFTPNGQPFCSGHAFQVIAQFLPGNKGTLLLNYLGGPNCALSNGGGIFGARVDNSGGDTIRFFCNGSEATGLVCQGTIASGETIRGSIGAYRGAGSPIPAEFSENLRSFRGAFTPV